MCRPLIRKYESRRGSSMIVMADGVHRFGMQAAGVGGAGGGRNIGRPVARSGRGCDSSSTAMAGARTHDLGAVPLSDRWHASVSSGTLARSLAVRSCSVDRDTPQTTGCTRGRGGGKEQSPHGRPQSPGELRCPGALDRDPTSPRSRRSDRRSRSSHRVCETRPAWRTPSLLASCGANTAARPEG